MRRLAQLGFVPVAAAFLAGASAATPLRPLVQIPDQLTEQFLATICATSVGFGPGFDASLCTEPRPPAVDIGAIEDEASALLQSFLRAPGGYPDPTDVGIPQPGTLGFGTAVCTRFVDGQPIVLPGCRGTGDPGYDPSIDGMLGGLLHPFTGQVFRSEIAALSWNLLMFLVLTSREDGSMAPDLFDGLMPLRSDGCSYARPTLCSGVQAFAAVPEPGARLLAMLGLLGLAAAGRRAGRLRHPV